MKKYIVQSSLLICILLAAIAMRPFKATRIIFFGDSITEGGVKPGGYIQLINQKLAATGDSANYELIGAGIGGNKIYDLYLRMDEDVLAKKPDVVVVWVGVNDVWHKASYGTGTDANKFEKFYTAVIKKLQAQGISVILCTPAVIGEKNDYSNQQDGDLNAYSSIIRRLADEYKCRLCDLRKIFVTYEVKNNPENKESGILTTDRVHLNAKGSELVASSLLEVLKK
jgi:lysophospholipase L1-like esterase